MLLGIDLGTSSVRAVAVDETGAVRAVGAREYGIDSPQPGWAEQDPDGWFACTCQAIGEVIAQGVDPSQIQAVGFSGQMHGTVLITANGAAVRPAIIWADQRSAPQCAEITANVGLERLAEITGNRISPGFMAATLAWVKQHEPSSLAKAAWALLPKDYLCYRLTGCVDAEPSDASSTLLFDIARRDWSDELTDAVGIPKTLLAPVVPSTKAVAGVCREAAAATGLVQGTPVVIGGGDQPIAAVGNGVLDPGTALCTIGTGGQLFCPTRQPVVDPKLRTNSFCHIAPDRWFVMGATLSAGLSLRWLRDKLGGGMNYGSLAVDAATVSPGAEGLFFLPYLVGERTPHMDPAARGCFIGLTPRHGIGHLARAVMEGVAYSMRDALGVFGELGLSVDRIIASGGGGSSPLWRQILADVLARPLGLVDGEERAGVGAALVAGVGVGVFRSLNDAVGKAVRRGAVTEPSDTAAFHAKAYPIFRELYGRLQEPFQRIAAL